MRRLGAAVVVAALSAPRLAQAHAPVEGIGDFYAGLLHPIVVPEHLIALAGAGLLLGQQGLEAARLGLAAFGFALIAGMLLGELAPAGDLVSALLMANALLLGAACAAGFRLPVLAPVGLVGAAAPLIGIDSGAGPFGPADPLVVLAGAATAALLIVFYLAAITLGLARPWQQIGVRIVGSWAAASALLVLVLEVAAGRAAGAG